MSADRLRALEGFVLGDSWVVPPESSEKEQRSATAKPEQSKDQHESEPEDKTKNLESSSSTISGPELIMPSIYEASIPEASWVAPETRPRAQSAKKKKTKRSSPEKAKKEEQEEAKETPTKPRADTDNPQEDKKAATEQEGLLKHTSKAILDWTLEKIIRPGINILLVAAILHTLVLPELVYNYPSLCSIAPVSNYYGPSCALQLHHPRHPKTDNGANLLSSRYESITVSQRQLETLFNKTLQTIAPLNNSLKQSESKLRDVQRDLKHVYPGVKNTLDLEFQFCWQATRTAAQEFDSLKADMQSAVDSLIAAGSLQQAEQDRRRPTSTSRTSQGQGESENKSKSKSRSRSKSHSDTARAARVSTQLSRREQYLERLRSRIRSKADSMAGNLAALNDHLESIEAVVDREGRSYRHRQAFLAGLSPVGDKLQAAFGALLPGLPERVLRVVKPAHGDDAASADGPVESVNRLLRDAANQHHPVMDLVQDLSWQLQDLQRSEG